MKKLIALVLILGCVLGLAGCVSKGENQLLADGPWGSQAIWADDYAQMYLVCTKGEDDANATVTAYLAVMSDWQPLRMYLKAGTNTVYFNAGDKTVLEANAKMEGGKLVLVNFHIPNGNFTEMQVDVELTKYAYTEMIDKLPF